MFRLDNLLERWAELYTPLSHTKDGRKSFFRIGMIDANSYFVRNFSAMQGACMTYATHVDAEINKQNTKQLSYRHVIYLLIKQPAGTLATNQVTDEIGPTEARFQTDDMVQDLLAVLFTMKSVANGKNLPSDLPVDSDVRQFLSEFTSDPAYREGLRGLQLEEAHWGTLPTMLNGWQICGLTIEQIAPRLLCVNQEKYILSDGETE
jgi:hypothetical protein